MNEKIKIFRNLIFKILFIIALLFLFSPKSEASIADFVASVNNNGEVVEEMSKENLGLKYVSLRGVASGPKGSWYTINVPATYGGGVFQYLVVGGNSYRQRSVTVYFVETTTRYYIATYLVQDSTSGGGNNSGGGSSGSGNWGTGGGDSYVPPPDTTPPTCSVSVSPSSMTNASSLTYKITFSENVTGFTKGDISFSGGGATVTSFSGSGRSYTAVVSTQNNADYTLSMSIKSGVCTDAAGNGNRASNTVRVPIDRIKPKITFTGASTNNSIHNQFASKDHTITVTFNARDNHYSSESLSANNISIKAGSQTINCTKNLTKQSVSGGVNYTLKLSNVTGDGKLEVIIPSGKIKDQAGNVNDKTSSSSSGTTINITIDNTKPEVKKASISSENKYGYVKNGERVTLDIEFSENLSNKPSVKIGGRVAQVTGSGSKFVATYDIPKNEKDLKEGELSIEISNYIDYVGLIGDTVTKTTDGSKIIYDRTPPKIDSIDPNGDTTWKKSHSLVISASDNFTAKKDITGEYDWILDGSTPLELVNKFINEAKLTKDTQTGKFRFYGVIRDLAGNETKVITNPFYLDNSFTNPGTLKITKESADGVIYQTHEKRGEDGVYNEGGYSKENLYIHKVDGTDDESGHDKTVYVVKKLENGQEIAVGEESIEDTIIETDGDYKITVTSYDKLGNSGTRIYIIHKGSVKVDFSPNGNDNYQLSVSTKVTVTDSTGLTNKIYYEWVKEGEEPKSLDTEIESGDTVSLSNVTGEYRLYIKTVDTDGNECIAKSEIFKLTSGITNVGTMIFRYNDEKGEEYTPNTYTKENIYMRINNQGSDLHGGKVTSTYKVTKKQESGTSISIGEYSTESTVLTTEGEYTVTVTSKNELGATATRVYKVLIDKTAPKVVFKGVEDYQQTGYIQVAVTDEGLCASGVNVDSLRYYWTRGKDTPTKEDFEGNDENGYRGKLNSSTSTVRTPSDVSGIWYLWIYAEDNVGNVAIKSNVKIEGGNVSYIDNEPPIAGTLRLTELTEPEREYVPDTYTKESVKIQLLNGYDADSGVKSNTYDIYKDGTLYKSDLIDETILTEHGKYTAIVTTVDNQDNESKREYIIKIDKKAPIISYEITNLEDYSMNKEVKVTIDDGENSGINENKIVFKWIGFMPNEYDSIGTVVNKINEYKDTYGTENYVEKLREIGIVILDQSYSKDAIDTPKGATGVYYLYVYAEDNVGNVVTELSEELKLDNTNPTKPEITVYEQESLEQYYGAIINKNIVVEAKNSKSLSGVDKYLYSISKDNGLTWDEWKEIEAKDGKASIVIEEDGIILVKMKAVAELLDGELESEESNSVIIRIDKKGPDCTFANYETGENGTTEYVKEILVRATLTDQNNNVINPNTLRYEWIKFESVDAYNAFANKSHTLDELKSMMTANAKSFANGEELPSPENANGIYSLFVYAEDMLGNASVNYSNIYCLSQNGNGNINEDGTTADGRLLGDLNGDGVVDIIDLSRLQQHLIGVRPLEEKYYKNADMNLDGEVDITDLSKLMYVIAMK